MQEVSHLVRNGYVGRISGLTYLGVQIPVYDTFEKEGAILPLSDPNAIAYILIHDISTNDDSPKCSINQNVSVQAQVVTKFNANTGESLHSELIGNAMLERLMSGGMKVEINLDGELQSWLSRLASSRPINSETSTNRIFSKNYIFSHKISQ